MTSHEHPWLVEQFEAHRPHLRGVAYRMLGSVADADEAVQEAWLRVSRAGADDVENLGGWLTTIVARICLNGLQSRKLRAEKILHLPDPIVTRADGSEDEVALSDSVGLALQIVLETLSPAERLAFVLHDMFDVPFDTIGPMVGRTPTAARQLASRARRRVRGASPPPDADVARQRRVVDAFFAAAHAGDFDALVAVLHPDVVRRSDGAAEGPPLVRGAVDVARSAASAAARGGGTIVPALVNGAAGAVAFRHGRPFAVFGFTVVGGLITEIDVVLGAERLARLDLGGLDAG
jgi:RNA polymerase sigma-70 factor (ECF subfamily)